MIQPPIIPYQNSLSQQSDNKTTSATIKNDSMYQVTYNNSI